MDTYATEIINCVITETVKKFISANQSALEKNKSQLKLLL